MPLVFPQQSGGFLNPTQFLGTYVNQDPSSYTEGNWWYRADLGTIYTYINGQVLPAISSTAIFIDSNATYTNTAFTEDVVILPNATLTIYGNVSFLKNLIVLGTLQSSNPNASSSSTENNNYTIYGMVYIQGTYSIAEYNNDTIYSQSTNLIIYGNGTISGAGTLIINSGYTLTINGNTTISILTISGAGTLIINSGYTLTINGNTTISVSTLNINANTLTINSGYTLTLNTNTTISATALLGSGTLIINSGYTLTIANNITISIPTISGAGTLIINSGYTLTQVANITISISTVNINGTWANAGYTITVPSGTTVTFNQSGSLTTGSTAGTLTVNGTVYWYGKAISLNGANLPSFPLTINGTGIFVGSPVYGGTATAKISLSSTSMSPGGYSSSNNSSGGNVYATFSVIKGSAVGKYGLEAYDNTAVIFLTWILIYIGTANTNYTVSGSWGADQSLKSGDTITLYNPPGSAGTITLTGTVYV